MVSKKDKDEIFRLRSEEKLSYEKIHEETGFSINTIMDVCKEKVMSTEWCPDCGTKMMLEKGKPIKCPTCGCELTLIDSIEALPQTEVNGIMCDKL